MDADIVVFLLKPPRHFAKQNACPSTGGELSQFPSCGGAGVVLHQKFQTNSKYALEPIQNWYGFPPVVPSASGRVRAGLGG
jgi:hypothetical protein